MLNYDSIKKKFRGLPFDTFIISDLNYNEESIRDVLTLPKLNNITQNKKVYFYTTNQHAELITWNKISNAIGIKFDIDITRPVGQSDYKETRKRYCLIQKIKPLTDKAKNNDNNNQTEKAYKSRIENSMENRLKKLPDEEDTIYFGSMNGGPEDSLNPNKNTCMESIDIDSLIKTSSNDARPFKKPQSSSNNNAVDSKMIYSNINNLICIDEDTTKENVGHTGGDDGKDGKDNSNTSTMNNTPDKDEIPDQLVMLGKRLIDTDGN